MASQIFIHSILLIVLMAAAVTDVRSSLVPNFFTFPLAFVGLGFHAISDSGNGVVFSLLGMGLGFALLLGFYVYGGMGAGDVKLLAAVGAVIGPFNVFVAFLVASLLGGLYAVSMMVWHLGLAQTAERIKIILVSMVFMKVNVTASLDQTTLPKLRYALVIGLGTLIGQGYLWYQVN